ncbi:MAG: ShlB/FhaC/HecB family hemolysin secretion/activation protein, partial [Rubrivivax sp.]
MLRIAVVEGRYGKVSINGALAGQAAPWLDDLRHGAPLGTELNARLRLLSEQPGVRAVAVLSPGDDIGEGDVAIDVQPERRFVGGLRLDNHGNAYAGRVRLTGQAAGQSLLRLGDRAGLVLGANSGNGWQGALSYALPVGHRGVRVGGSISQHRYQLGKDFKALEASGDVNAADLQLSWPIHRSAGLRLEGQVALELQRIRHLRGAVNVDDRRHGTATQLAINGSGSGSAGGAAGRLWIDAGHLTLLNAAQLRFDAATARTAGHYGRLGADVSAITWLGGSTLFLRGAGQWSRANLDSSKKFVLGGADGVRAWPSGDGAGDDAALLQ